MSIESITVIIIVEFLKVNVKKMTTKICESGWSKLSLKCSKDLILSVRKVKVVINFLLILSTQFKISEVTTKGRVNKSQVTKRVQSDLNAHSHTINFKKTEKRKSKHNMWDK